MGLLCNNLVYALIFNKSNVPLGEIPVLFRLCYCSCSTGNKALDVGIAFLFLSQNLVLCDIMYDFASLHQNAIDTPLTREEFDNLKANQYRNNNRSPKSGVNIKKKGQKLVSVSSD